MANQKKTVSETKTEEKVEIKTTTLKKKFTADDLITCVSITPGEVFFVGDKTKDLYTFADMGDEVEIPFKDLDYAARTNNVMLYKPRFVVQNKEFTELYPKLDNVYSTLHSTKDLRDILKMSPEQMKIAIESLPLGAKESVKTIAATMVENGTLDSLKRIQVIDSIFGTELLLKLNLQ